MEEGDEALASMATLLKIRDWEMHFENQWTREHKKLAFVPFPNKLDGDGYTELLSHKDGPAHFGAWVVIAQVASKCVPRGKLLRDGNKPHDLESLSRITRFPQAVLNCAIERLLLIGWLDVEEVADPEPVAATNGLAEKPEVRMQKIKKPVFVPPSVDDVSEYCRSRSNSVDALQFVEFYSSKGWMVGKNQMKDWKASVRTWEHRSRTEACAKPLPFSGLEEFAREHGET